MTAAPSPHPEPAPPRPRTSPDATGPARLHRPPGPGGATRSRLALAEVSEQVPAVGSVQGALALDLPAGANEPLPAALAVVPPTARGGVEDGTDPAAEVRAWAARFAQALVEVTGGDRPVTQLLRWTSPAVYQDLDRRTRILARTRVGPARRRAVRPQVRSVHVFLPGAGTAEVSVHVRYGQRSRALAARLERRRDRWTCTVLQLG